MQNNVLYNRVEGLGLRYGFRSTSQVLANSVFSLTVGYGFKDRRWKSESSFLQFLGKRQRLFLEANIYNSLAFEEDIDLIGTGANTITSLFYKGDYRDYYYRAGGNLGLGYRLTDNLALKCAVVLQKESLATSHTRFSFFRGSEPFRSNPDVSQGRFHGLQALLLYRTSDFDLDISAEHANKNILDGDFSYSFIKANLQRKMRLTRHSDFHVSVSAATSSGALTPQRWFDLGGKTWLNYHGLLRGVDYKTFTGDRMASAVAEYALKGNALAENDLIKALKLTLWSGVGWSSLSSRSRNPAAGLDAPRRTTDEMYHEIGIGMGDVLNIFRFDVARNNLHENKLLFSFNLLR